MFSILISIFGHIIVIRTLKFLISIQIIPKVSFKKQNFMSLTLNLILFFIFYRRIDLMWVIYFAIFMVPFLVLCIQEQTRKKIFQRNLISILDNLIIQIRTGKSLRDAVLETAAQLKDPLRYYLHEMSSAMEFSSNLESKIKDPLFSETLSELVHIHRAAHKQIDRIKTFRRKVKIEEDFRRKSGQVSMQTRAQALVLGIIFCGLLLFTLTVHGFAGNESIISSALALYFIGLILLFRIGRGYKWKV